MTCKQVTVRVRGKRRKRTRCKTKLLASALATTTTTRATATISTGSRVRARGTARVTRTGASVTLSPRRALPAGVYTLRIARRGRVIARRPVLVR